MRESTILPTLEQLINVNGLSLNFNLREPKGNKATNVYAILRVGQVQLKISTMCKVNSWQWDKKKQLPLINGNITKRDLHNNLRVFSLLSRIRLEILNLISEDFAYNTLEELRKLINNIVVSNLNDDNMNNENLSKSVTRTPQASTLLNKAFNIYYGTYRKVKEVSRSRELGKLNAFIAYCEEKGINKVSSISQKGLNNYKNYLIKKSKEEGSKGDSNSTINAKCQTVAKIINFMAGDENFSRYNISKVECNLLQEIHPRGEDKKRRPLTKGELDKLISCEKLNEKEKEYRDLFILQCYAGYRVSDTEKMFDPSLQRIHKKGGNSYITILPQKEETRKIIAVIWLNKTVRSILDRYKQGFKYVNISSINYSQNLNYNLRNIFKKSGLDSIEEWTDAKGVTHKDKLCNIISSHFARYTFIYNGLFAYGFTPSELKDFTGHSDETMINEVYNVHSADDTVAVANKAIQRVTMDETRKNKADILSSHYVISPLNELFAYDSFVSIFGLMNINNDVFHLDSTKKAIKRMKDISMLNNFSKDTDISKVVELEKVVFELSYYFRDTLLYSVYKYKEQYFGLNVDVPSTEDVESMFIQEDIERPEKQKQAELEEWEDCHK